MPSPRASGPLRFMPRFVDTLPRYGRYEGIGEAAARAVEKAEHWHFQHVKKGT
jgi:hypothetical protein